MKLDNQLPYHSMSLPDTGSVCIFNPLNLTYKTVNTLGRRNRSALGEIEVDFLSIKTGVDKMYQFLKENMQKYIAEYNICCPAPARLSTIMT